MCLITGTQFENNFKELRNLLSMANTDGFSEQTLNALALLYDEAERKVIESSKSPSTGLQFTLLHSFAHFYAFNLGIVKNLVSRIQMTDRQVGHDWEGKIPEK